MPKISLPGAFRTSRCRSTLPFAPRGDRDEKASVVIEIPPGVLTKKVNIDDRHQRVHQTVSVFADRLMDVARTEDTSVDVWFVVIPYVVYQNCRPGSNVSTEIRIKSTSSVGSKLGRRLLRWPSLFAQENVDAQVYMYDVDFHNPLKARLLASRMLTQAKARTTVCDRTFLPDSWLHSVLFRWRSQQAPAPRYSVPSQRS